MATQSVRSMISETSICNQALSWLGAREITSLEDPSTEAEYCRNNYPFLRDAVLEERMWTFATERATSTVADLDDWGILYKHPIPLDWMAVYRVYSDVNGTNSDWSREGRYILAPETTVYMWGLKRITDTGQMSTMFVEALAARLAADLAIPLTENRQLQVDMWNLYQQKLKEAAARDGMQGRNERVRDGGLITSRRSSIAGRPGNSFN